MVMWLKVGIIYHALGQAKYGKGVLRFDIFLRSDHYFGRGGFMECYLTIQSIAYGLTILTIQKWIDLPVSVRPLFWEGIPQWAFALPWLIAGGVSLLGIVILFLLSHPINRHLRFYGMLGQIACFTSALILGIIQNLINQTDITFLEILNLLNTIAGTRTLVVIWLRRA